MSYCLIQPPKVTPLPSGQPSIYLAGDIIGKDWQSFAISRLCGFGDITIVNPRRDDCDLRFEAMQEQLKWQHEYLDKVNQVIFWFDVDTRPGTLIELGIRLREYRRRNYVDAPICQPMFIGCHPLYAHKYDVYGQVRLEGFTAMVATNLEDLLVEVLEFNQLKKLIS